MQYRVLFHPGHIRAYPEKAETLALSELRHAASALSLTDIAAETAGGRVWLSFSSGHELCGAGVELLYSLSFVYEVFSVRGEMLMPLTPPQPRFTPDMPAMLKYTGKTSEVFTRMLVNAARFSSRVPGGAASLLDPLCGKGTTLFSAAMLGMSSAGIDKRASDIHEAAVFLKQYLETAHCKHEIKKDTLTASNGKKAGESHTFTFSPGKEQWKRKERQTLRLLCCDTCLGGQFLARGSFDCMAADLPYGVQHGAQEEKLERSPAALLRSALPVWRGLLRTGGAAAIGWNINVLKREALIDIFTGCGFTLRQTELDTTHRVSQAINRDYAVFIKEE